MPKRDGTAKAAEWKEALINDRDYLKGIVTEVLQQFLEAEMGILDTQRLMYTRARNDPPLGNGILDTQRLMYTRARNDPPLGPPIQQNRHSGTARGQHMKPNTWGGRPGQLTHRMDRPAWLSALSSCCL